MNAILTGSPRSRLVAAALGATLALSGTGIAIAPNMAFADPAADQASAVKPYEGPVVLARFDANVRADMTSALGQLVAEGESTPAYDGALAKMAAQRAAEAVISGTMVRPDGSDPVTAAPDGRSVDEILVVGAADAEAVMASLSSAQSNLLLDATSYGVAVVEGTDGTLYWAIELASDGIADPTVVDLDGTTSFEISLPSGAVSVPEVNPLDLNVDETATITLQASTQSPIEPAVILTSVPVLLDPASLTWESSDPTVASVDDKGVVTALSGGQVTISAADSEGTLLASVDTHVNASAEVIDLASCTVAGITDDAVANGSPVEPSFSVIAPDGVTYVDAAQYSAAFTDNVEPGTATLTITAVEGSPVCTGSVVKQFQIQEPAVTTTLVPDVRNFSLDAASAAVSAAGLVPVPKEGSAAPTAEAAGIVAGTAPEQGSSLEIGAEVDLWYYGAYVEPEPTPVDEPADPADDPAVPSGEPTEPAGDTTAPGDDPAGDPADGTSDPETPLNPVVASIDEVSLSIPQEVYAYTGEPICPEVTAVFGDVSLKSGVDFVASYSDNTEIGTASILVQGIGSVSGSAELKFHITADGLPPVEEAAEPVDLAAAGFGLGGLTPQTRTGSEIKLVPVVVNLEGELTEGIDFEVSYEGDLIGPGVVNVTVTGINNYCGTLTGSYEIVGSGDETAPVNFDEAIVEAIEDQYYTGAALEPRPVVKLGEATLVAGTDYDLAYAANVNVGTGMVSISGKGTYEGMSLAASFKILPRDIASARVTAPADVDYNGAAQLSKPVLSDGGRTLTEGVDYTLSYADNVNAGVASVVITGIGNYTGTTPTVFAIRQVDISKATIEMPNMHYTGGALTPAPVSVVVNGMSLAAGVDYQIVGYSSNIQVGDAKVTLQGLGNYSGAVAANWKIVDADSTQTGTTQTLPKTGDDTNMLPVVIGGIVGAVLIAGGIVLIVRNRKR